MVEIIDKNDAPEAVKNAKVVGGSTFFDADISERFEAEPKSVKSTGKTISKVVTRENIEEAYASAQQIAVDAQTPENVNKGPLKAYEGKYDYKYLSRETVDIMHKNASTGAISAKESLNSVPYAIKLGTAISSENYGTAVLTGIQMLPGVIRQKTAQYKNMIGSVEGYQSYKKDIEGLSKEERKLARKELTECQVKALEHLDSADKQLFKDKAAEGIDKGVEALASRADRIKRAESIAPSGASADYGVELGG